MNVRLIKIRKNKIYFTNNFYVSLNQTNFPKGSISFRSHIDIYLKVELLNYDPNNKFLEVKIIDYSPENTNSFLDQKIKRPIEKLVFRELDWTKLKKLLMNFLTTLPKKIPEAFKKESQVVIIEKPIIDDNVNVEAVQKEPEIITRELVLNVLFSDAHFHLGYISIIKKLPYFKHPIELKITNNLILSEYDYIKNYFSKYYRSDSFDVTVIIKSKGEEILSIDCNSKMIKNIDEKLIENVKTRRTLDLIKVETKTKNKKNTYNANEILSELDDSSNVFGQKEIEILITIIESKSPRNAKQLIYLSGEKHDIKNKIRFTLSPLFGFIFFISGEKQNHICWELLDSHATYLWSFHKEMSIESQIQLSELNINTIREIGRQKYRSSIKNKQIDINSVFSVINHSKSKNLDTFEIWRNKLEKKIV